MTLENYLATNPFLRSTVVGYILKDNDILLGLRKRVTLGLGEKLIAGIGGKVEPGETTKQALTREFIEEIDVTITASKLLGKITYLFPHKPAWNQKAAVYIITGWVGVPKETEDIKPMWFKNNNLPKKRMWPDNLFTIPPVLAGEKIEGAFLYNEAGKIEEYHLRETK